MLFQNFFVSLKNLKLKKPPHWERLSFFGGGPFLGPVLGKHRGPNNPFSRFPPTFFFFSGFGFGGGPGGLVDVLWCFFFPIWFLGCYLNLGGGGGGRGGWDCFFWNPQVFFEGFFFKGC